MGREASYRLDPAHGQLEVKSSGWSPAPSQVKPFPLISANSVERAHVEERERRGRREQWRGKVTGEGKRKDSLNSYSSEEAHIKLHPSLQMHFPGTIQNQLHLCQGEMHLKSSQNNRASSWVRRLVEQPRPGWCPLLPCTELWWILSFWPQWINQINQRKDSTLSPPLPNSTPTFTRTYISGGNPEGKSWEVSKEFYLSNILCSENNVTYLKNIYK